MFLLITMDRDPLIKSFNERIYAERFGDDLVEADKADTYRIFEYNPEFQELNKIIDIDGYQLVKDEPKRGGWGFGNPEGRTIPGGSGVKFIEHFYPGDKVWIKRGNKAIEIEVIRVSMRKAEIGTDIRYEFSGGSVYNSSLVFPTKEALIESL